MQTPTLALRLLEGLSSLASFGDGMGSGPEVQWDPSERQQNPKQEIGIREPDITLGVKEVLQIKASRRSESVKPGNFKTESQRSRNKQFFCSFPHPILSVGWAFQSLLTGKSLNKFLPSHSHSKGLRNYFRSHFLSKSVDLGLQQGSTI